MKKYDRERGFIALISTVIIAAILLAMMASTEFASFYARSDAFNSENTYAARALAASCINVALLALATSTAPASYNPIDQSVAVDTDIRGNLETCTIKSVIHTESGVTINTFASVDNSFGNVSMTVTLPPRIQILSWREQ